MKKSLLTTLFLLTLAVQGFSQQNFLDTIWSAGLRRTFRVYVPAIYDGQTPRPLVFLFHGVGGSGAEMEVYTKFRRVADTANFILVSPNGTIGTLISSTYGRTWNNFNFNAVDDVLFVSNLIDTLVGKYRIDTTRMYSAGFSNGGFMGYDLACRLNRRIAAIASVGGSIGISRLASCKPNRAVPIMEIHGTNDLVVPYKGGSFAGIGFLPVDTVINYWRRNNQCSPAATVTNLPNINTSDGSRVERHSWPNCTGGSSVELLKVVDGGHTWPGATGAQTNRDIIADQEIWRFFLKHKLSETSSVVEHPTFLKWAVSPNPTSDNLNVSFGDNQNFREQASLMVADFYGRILVRKELPSGDWGKNITLKLNEIPAGGYFLILEIEGHGRAFQRFVVSR